MQRADGRRADQMRPVRIVYDAFGYAPGCVLFELGNTKVLCAVSLQTGVPPFLKGRKVGWLTAEYAMLPTAVHQRLTRDTYPKGNGRAIEISRLISRSLRAVVDLSKLGERTIVIDCDVLQADGGTRTACITGAYIALQRAIAHWVATHELSETILTDAVAAVSVGFKDSTILLDIDFAEDSAIDADYNFVLTRSGALVEVQGTAEKYPLSWSLLEQAYQIAYTGVTTLFQPLTADQLPIIPHAEDSSQAASVRSNEPKQARKSGEPLFCLKNRLVAPK